MLTPQMIQAMNAATGNNVSPTGAPKVTSRAEQIRAMANTATAPEPVEKDFGDRVADEQIAGAERIKKSILGATDKALGDNPSIGKQVKAGLNAAAGTVAGAAQSVLAPVTTAISPIISKATAVDPRISEKMKAKHPKLQSVFDSISQITEKYPEDTELAKNLFDAVTTIVGGGAGKNVAKGTLENQTLKGAIKDTGKGATEDLYKAITTKSPQQIDAAMTKNYEKGIKPSVAGKKTMGQMETYNNKAKQAVQSIVNNKDNLNIVDEFGEATGKLPRNIKQFADAIEQTKKKIFEKYDSLQKSAGSAGAKVDLAPVSKELRDIQNDATIQDLHPEIARYAQSRADAFDARGTYTTQQAQDAIANLNKSLDAFYKNPSYENASKASIDSMIANNMRKNLDDVIESTGEAGYQALKDEYGALKTIEKDVVHRAIVDARKNAKGLIDFTDIASGAEVIKGLATMNPANLATGVGMKGIAQYMKYINNPNNAVKRLFQIAEKNKDIISPKGSPTMGKNEVFFRGQKNVGDNFTKNNNGSMLGNAPHFSSVKEVAQQYGKNIKEFSFKKEANIKKYDGTYDLMKEVNEWADTKGGTYRFNTESNQIVSDWAKANKIDGVIVGENGAVFNNNSVLNKK